MLLKYCDDNNLVLTSLKKTLIGGSAIPLSMIEKFWNKHSVETIQGWGMTELAPLGTMTVFNTDELKLPIEKKNQLTLKAGKTNFGCDMKLIDDEGKDLPNDGKT